MVCKADGFYPICVCLCIILALFYNSYSSLTHVFFLSLSLFSYITWDPTISLEMSTLCLLQQRRKKTELPKHLQGLMGEANLKFARGEHQEAINMCLEVIRLGNKLYFFAYCEGNANTFVFLHKENSVNVSFPNNPLHPLYSKSHGPTIAECC